MKYCPICNANSDEVKFVGELCISCFTKKASQNLPKVLNIIKCPKCGRVKTPGGWLKESRFALDAIAARELKAKGFTPSIISVDYAARKAEASFYTEEEGEKITINKAIDLDVDKQVCITCVRKASGYYEAIVQLRGEASKVKGVQNKLSKFIERRGAFITKVDEYSYGCDIYTSDKKATETFLKAYKIKAKKSFRLFSVRNGKPLYRNIYSAEV